MFSCEFRKSFKRAYLVKYFEQLLLDRYKVTTENYYPLSEISVFFELGITESASSGYLVLDSTEN